MNIDKRSSAQDLENLECVSGYKHKWVHSIGGQRCQYCGAKWWIKLRIAEKNYRVEQEQEGESRE